MLLKKNPYELNCSKPCVVNAIRSLLIARYRSSHNCKISKVSTRTAIEFQRAWGTIGKERLQSVEGHVRIRVVSRLIKAYARRCHFNPAVRGNWRIGRDTGHYSNRPPNFGCATPRIALGGAAIIEGAVGSCHVLKPVITHAFTARIIPFWQVASHSM